MNDKPGFDTYLTFINAQLSPSKPTEGIAAEPARYRAVTISRESGSGAHAIAATLADKLQAGNKSGGRPWTVFDRELMKQVLEDHHLPARMMEFIPEDRMSELQDAVQDLFGLRPASWTLIQHTSETILRLVELGNVILIGRGANIVTRDRHDVLHLRFVSSVDSRVDRLQEARGISHKAALAALHQEDRGRQRYLKRYFGVSINDPLQYHCTINTGLSSHETVAAMLYRLVMDGLKNS